MTNPLDALPLVCPHDGLSLLRDRQVLRCAAGHVFDIARQGHANVLPVGRKASRDPGDSVDMVRARRNVLDSGFLAPLRDALIEHPAIVAALDANALVVDAGCGDGYYTAALAERWPRCAMLGIDVSKHAIRMAAQRHREVAWLVASNRRLPVVPGACDLILSLFGFACWDVWAEHQRDEQCVVSVDPGPRHLIELRERIYDRVRLHAPPARAAAQAAGYRLHDERALSVERRDVPMAQLLAMTPHGHRATPAAREQLLERPPSSMTIDVVVRTWRRCPP